MIWSLGLAIMTPKSRPINVMNDMDKNLRVEFMYMPS